MAKYTGLHPGRQIVPYTRLSDEAEFGTVITPSQFAKSTVSEPGPEQLLPPGKQAQLGTIIQRLPDIAFQPEAADFVNWTIPETACFTLFSSSTVYSRLFNRNVGIDRKLVITRIEFFFSNAYMPANVDLQLRINGDVLDLPILVNAGADAIYPVRFVVRGIKEVELWGKLRFATSIALGDYSARISGHETSDLTALNERMLR